MSERFIYHYHAVSRERPDREIYIDGLLNCGTEILTMADYRRIKQVIVTDMAKDDGIDVKGLSVTSLTLLSKTDREWEEADL